MIYIFNRILKHLWFLVFMKSHLIHLSTANCVSEITWGIEWKRWSNADSMFILIHQSESQLNANRSRKFLIWSWSPFYFGMCEPWSCYLSRAFHPLSESLDTPWSRLPDNLQHLLSHLLFLICKCCPPVVSIAPPLLGNRVNKEHSFRRFCVCKPTTPANTG